MPELYTPNIDFAFHPWMDIALREAGIHEIPGPKSNARIDEYIQSVDGAANFTDDDAWCSIYINWIMLEAGCQRTRSAAARSWLKIGIELYEPVYGCIAVYWRESLQSGKGHVHLVLRADKTEIWGWGGNQSNQVCAAPYLREQLLGFRWPVLIG